jgi:hypothetical protein
MGVGVGVRAQEADDSSSTSEGAERRTSRRAAHRVRGEGEGVIIIATYEGCLMGAARIFDAFDV